MKTIILIIGGWLALWSTGVCQIEEQDTGQLKTVKLDSALIAYYSSSLQNIARLERLHYAEFDFTEERRERDSTVYLFTNRYASLKVHHWCLKTVEQRKKAKIVGKVNEEEGIFFAMWIVCRGRTPIHGRIVITTKGKRT